MLSSDLKMLSSELEKRQSPDGSLYLTPTYVRLVGFVLDDAIGLARQMEASAVRPNTRLIDINDPKIELFPKRPIPVCEPGDDGAA